MTKQAVKYNLYLTAFYFLKMERKKMYNINSKGLLTLQEEEITYIESPNVSRLEKPLYLIIHFTASHANAKSIADFFSKASSKVSAHFTIDFDGSLVQSVPLTKAAWHAGKSRWLNINELNSYSIGIEVCNPGPLDIIERNNDKVYKSWFGKFYYPYQEIIIEEKHPITGELKGWIPFNAKQIETLLNLGEFLYNYFEMIDVLGHDMISLFRKTDPGPCLSTIVYEQIKKELNENDRDPYDYPVKNIRNDIRTSPSENAMVLIPESGIKSTIKHAKIVDRVGYWFELELNRKVNFLERETTRGFVKISDVEY